MKSGWVGGQFLEGEEGSRTAKLCKATLGTNEQGEPQCNNNYGCSVISMLTYSIACIHTHGGVHGS